MTCFHELSPSRCATRCNDRRPNGALFVPTDQCRAGDMRSTRSRPTAFRGWVRAKSSPPPRRRVGEARVIPRSSRAVTDVVTTARPAFATTDDSGHSGLPEHPRVAGTRTLPSPTSGCAAPAVARGDDTHPRCAATTRDPRGANPLTLGGAQVDAALDARPRRRARRAGRGHAGVTSLELV